MKPLPAQHVAPDLDQLYRALGTFRRDWVARFGQQPTALLLIAFRLYDYVMCNVNPLDPMNPWTPGTIGGGAGSCFGFPIVPVSDLNGPLGEWGWQIGIIGQPVPGLYIPGTIDPRNLRT